MQFNSSLNRQESILALTQVTKEQKVQELSLSVTRMSPNGVCVQARDYVAPRLNTTVHRRVSPTHQPRNHSGVRASTRTKNIGTTVKGSISQSGLNQYITTIDGLLQR